jgi:LysR family transcriptional regulator, hydrogen peroxide-inducible genes activator
MVTLRQLRYFEALAQARHFGQAAQRCAVTQPALSMQIKDLEQSLGVALVERRANGVALTPAGEEIAARAESILAQVRALQDYARERSGPLVGSLRLGMIPSIAPYLLPKLLATAGEQYPSLELLIRESQTAVLLEELARGELDGVVAALPLDRADLESSALFDDPFYIAVQAKAAMDWADTEDVIARLRRERLLLLEEGHCLRDQALQVCQIADTQARRSLGATSLATIMQMVAAGHGITLVPEMCIAVDVDRTRVALVKFPDPPPARIIGLAWRRTFVRKDDFLVLSELIQGCHRLHQI